MRTVSEHSEVEKLAPVIVLQNLGIYGGDAEFLSRICLVVEAVSKWEGSRVGTDR